uniref:RING-type domain-containing protein n=1 Tax=Arundo donax TaxID=35708 RepID=A0A0A8YY35_ARUDO
MEPKRDSDYVLNEWAFEARNRLNREYFALVRKEREEANIHPNYDAHWQEETDFFCGVPASSKAMVILHTPHTPIVGEMKEQDCAVCLKDFKERDKLSMMPCSHSFHQRCIFDWLFLSGVCPCCRLALPFTYEQRLLDEQIVRVQDEVGTLVATDDL